MKNFDKILDYIKNFQSGQNEIKSAVEQVKEHQLFISNQVDDINKQLKALWNDQKKLNMIWKM